jgi:hypothetical protein
MKTQYNESKLKEQFILLCNLLEKKVAQRKGRDERALEPNAKWFTLLFKKEHVSNRIQNLFSQNQTRTLNQVLISQSNLSIKLMVPESDAYVFIITLCNFDFPFVMSFNLKC